MCVACNYTIHAKSHHFGWNRDFAPVQVAKPGETIHFECLDSSGGQLGADATVASIATLDFGRINPVTGPVFVEGAEPGDALKVYDPQFHPVRRRLDREYSRLRPSRGPVHRAGAACLDL